MANDAQVVRNDDAGRYELQVDGRAAGVLTFEDRDGVLALLHTEVDPQLEGRGWGTRLVGDALDDLRSRGEQVLPYCPFVAAHLRQHPELVEVVPARQRATFGLG
ncbi:MAG: GNAT family N-acetyltransferase [Actinomycetales bacterium]